MYMTSLLDVLLDPLPLCPPIFVWWMTRDNTPSQSFFFKVGRIPLCLHASPSTAGGGTNLRGNFLYLACCA